MEHQHGERNPLKKNTVLLLMSIAVLLVIAAVTLLLPGSGNAPEAPGEDARRAAAGEAVTVAEGAELLQTLTYTRCEHVVTRRVTAPVELYGKTLEEVQALYPEWKITEFSAKEVAMEQQPDIFCPDHMVLMPNGAGVLCIFENKYGDALALVNELETDIRSLPAAIQEELRQGVGFSTLAELEQWLESVES